MPELPTRRRRWAVCERRPRACWAAVLVAAAAAWAQAANLSIDVDERQRVSMSGSSESLRDAVAELCERANVELVAYEAEDRPFSAAFRDVPLQEVLARLLRAEIYLVGLRSVPGERRAAVSWLRVSGAAGSVGGGPVRGGAPAAQAPAIDIGVAADVVQTALESDDPIARNTARRTILENLRSNPGALERFLDTDATTVVDRLIDSRHAAEFLNSLQSVAPDVKYRSRIQTLVRALRLRQEAARREAAGGR